MILRRTNSFVKQFKRLTPRMQNQFTERLALWLSDQSHPQLHVHILHGAYAGYWSFNVSGDIRAIYTFEGDTVVVFAFIGTHSKLY